MEKKKNVIQIITIVLLVITICVGGFLIYNEYFVKDDKPTCNCEKCNVKDDDNTTTTDNQNTNTFDGTKSLNTSKVYEKASNATNVDFVTVALNSDAKSANVNVSLAKYKEINVITNNNVKNNNAITFKSNSFNSAIKNVTVGKSDQSFGYETVLYVLEDGSIYYSYVLNAINALSSTTNAVLATNAITDMSDIKEIIPACVKDSELSECTYLAVRNDGSFYDLSEIIKKAY